MQLRKSKLEEIAREARGSRREFIYLYIIEFKKQHNGLAPNVREIGDALAEINKGKSVSSSVVKHQLDALVKEGRIYKPLDGGFTRNIGVYGYEFTAKS